MSQPHTVRLHHRLVVAVSALALTGALTRAAPALTPEDLDRIAQPYLENRALGAAAIGVVQRGQTVTALVGSAGSETGTLSGDERLYEIGSITKVFTSLLLAEAVVRGEVTLDTPVASLLPADVVLPGGAGDRITLRMLATHTSGLPRIPVEIPPDNLENPYAMFDDVALWASLRRVKLDFEPGTKAGYSNLAGGLLGTLLARQAGVTYEQLLAGRITRPLGMTQTMIVIPDALRERFAVGHNGQGLPWSHWEFQALAGAGAIRSTVGDMARFARAMLEPDATPLREAIELAWVPQDLAATAFPGGQGLGWLIAGDGRTHWHNGMTGGFHAALFVNRELGAASVVLANRSAPAGTELAERLLRTAAGMPERPAPNRDRADIALSAEQLDRCVGIYRVNPRLALVIERREQVLVVTPTGQGTDRLYAESPETFFSRRVAADIVFEFPPDGGLALALVLKQDGREARAPRE